MDANDDMYLIRMFMAWIEMYENEWERVIPSYVCQRNKKN
jgi:hypothetical protein